MGGPHRGAGARRHPPVPAPVRNISCLRGGGGGAYAPRLVHSVLPEAAGVPTHLHRAPPRGRRGAPHATPCVGSAAAARSTTQSPTASALPASPRTKAIVL